MNETIKTLFSLAAQISFYYESYKTTRQNRDIINGFKYENDYYNKNLFADSICSIILNSIPLKACSFLDEYNKGLTTYNYPIYADRISKIKKILKPISKKINKWTDLKNYRNQILAHNLKRDGQYIMTDGQLIKYNIPNTDREILLLSELIMMMNIEISQEFSEITQSLDYSKTLNDYIITDLRRIDFFHEMMLVRNEIDKIKSGLI